MSLLILPTELLELIFSHVGIEFFRADVSRLSVCSQWYFVAHRMFLRTLILFPDNLEVYKDSGLRDKHSTARDETKDLRISLSSSTDSFHHCQSMFEPRESAFELPDTVRARIRLRPTVWVTDDLRNAVADVVDDVPFFKKLEAFRLRVSDRGTPTPRLQKGNVYPYRQLFNGLQCLSTMLPATLTTLELTFDNEAFAFVDGNQPHICPIVARFLPKIKNLGVHLETTCVDLFRLPDGVDTIMLEKLLVNLDPRVESYRHARGHWTGCRPSRSARGRFFSLQKTSMIEAAKALAQRMRNPKLARLLFGIGPNAPHLYVSVDCITGDEMALAQGAQPYEDGELMEDATGRLSSYKSFWDHVH